MPQLDFSTYPSQILGLVISFGILYWFIAFFVVPWHNSITLKRRQAINDVIEQTKTLQAQTTILIAEYEAKMATTRKKVSKWAKSERGKIQVRIDKQLIRAFDRIQTKTTKMEEKIIKARSKALAESENLSGSLAKLLHAKVLNTKVKK